MVDQVDVVLTSILRGSFDGDLERLAEAVASRKRVVLESTAFTLRKGDKVRIVGSISPRYLIGRTATFERYEGRRLYARLDARVGRFGTYEIGFPLGSLEKAE